MTVREIHRTTYTDNREAILSTLVVDERSWKYTLINRYCPIENSFLMYNKVALTKALPSLLFLIVNC
jgi:hypothetical protein